MSLQVDNNISEGNNINKYKDIEKEIGGCPRGVMVKAMDYGIVVSEFVF